MFAPRISTVLLLVLPFMGALGGQALTPATSPDPGTLALAEPERVRLATIESRGLVLSRRGWPALAQAIASGETETIKKSFSADFEGQPLEVESGHGPDLTAVRVRRAEATGSVTVSADEFAAFLVALRQRFGVGAKVEFALMSLSPTDRNDFDGSWRGSAALRLVGPRPGGEPAELMAKIEFELKSIPDVDAIATLPGWIRRMRVAELQEGAAPHPLFAEVAASWGIDRRRIYDNWLAPLDKRPILTGSVFVADVDNDGWDDVLLTDVIGLFLYRGIGPGKFEDVTAASGLPGALRGLFNAIWGDFDGDGLVDLISQQRVFRNLGGCRFEDITAAVPFEFGAIVSGFSVGDYDRDGRLDLYVSRNDGPGKTTGVNSWIDGPGGPGNQLWRNLGGWKFEEVSARANAQAGRRSVFASVWLDADEDGWPDIFVINEFGGGLLLVNTGDGSFREQALIDDTGDFGSMGLAVGDYNNDGHIDLYTANMYSKAGRRIMENLDPGAYAPEVFAKMKRFVTGSELYRNEGGLKFSRQGKALRVHAVGWAYGAAFTDFDNDGFLDLYATAGFMSVNKLEPDG